MTPSALVTMRISRNGWWCSIALQAWQRNAPGAAPPTLTGSSAGQRSES